MNDITISRQDFMALHNNSVEMLSKIAIATNSKRGLTEKETMEIFKLCYPIVKGVQDLAIENDFLFCI